MVKKHFAFVVFFFICYVNASPLTDKIKNLVNQKDFDTHKDFIDILFKNEDKFLTNSRLNTLKIIKTLKDNGLFKFMFKEPVDMSISFEVQNTDSVLLSIKSIQDALYAIGYGFFITTQAQYTNTLKWSIGLKTNIGVDPILLNQELQKRGITIEDVTKYGTTKWAYKLNTRHIRLGDTYKIKKYEIKKIKKRSSDIFLQPNEISNGHSMLEIVSASKNTWYPYISFYDKKLNILKIKKVDKIIKKLRTRIPVDSFYIKISDIYTNKNFNNGFKVSIK